MFSRLSILAVVGAFIFCTLFGIYSFSATDRVAYQSDTPFYILEASKEDVLSDAFVGAIELSDTNVAMFRQDTTNIDIVGQSRREKVSVGTGPVGDVSISPNGEILIAKDGLLKILDSKGNRRGGFSIPPSTKSIAAVGDNIVVSAPGEGLMTLYNRTGEVLARIGSLDALDKDVTENRFLNAGTLAVTAAGEIYNVSIFSPNPKVQKFSATGDLINEFPVSGPAIEVQTNREKEFLSTKSFTCTGGYFVTRSASVDPSTNHLWIGMNGLREKKVTRAESGTLYEYGPDGRKLAEYALKIPIEDKHNVLTDIKDIKVSFPNAYVLSSNGVTHRFNLERRQRAIPVGPQIRKGLLGLLLGTEVLADEEAGCDPELSPTYSCKANCQSGYIPNTGVACDAELLGYVHLGQVVTNGSCSVNSSPGSCSGSITTCTTLTGVVVTHSTSITCTLAPTPTPPPPTPEPTPTPECVDPPLEPSACNSGYHWSICLGDCVDGNGNPDPSPIIIDVNGNGFAMTNSANGVSFDLNADGVKESLSWTAAGSDDAWLVLDRNDNGSIDDGTELFGNYTPQSRPPAGKVKNGFLALAEFDKPANGGNGDGKITVQDNIFNSLCLWQDVNHNGVSEASELKTLNQLGIAQIDLDYKFSKRTDQYGNQFKYRAKVKDVHGAQVGRGAWDVFLVWQP